VAVEVLEAPYAGFRHIVIRPEHGRVQRAVIPDEAGVVVGEGKVRIPYFDEDVPAIVCQDGHAGILEHVDIEELFPRPAPANDQDNPFQGIAMEHRNGIGYAPFVRGTAHSDVLFLHGALKEAFLLVRHLNTVQGKAAIVAEKAHFGIVPELLILGEQSVGLFYRGAAFQFFGQLFGQLGEELLHRNDAVADDCGSQFGRFVRIGIRPADDGGVQAERHLEGGELEEEDDGDGDLAGDLGGTGKDWCHGNVLLEGKLTRSGHKAQSPRTARRAGPQDFVTL